MAGSFEPLPATARHAEGEPGASGARVTRLLGAYMEADPEAFDRLIRRRGGSRAGFPL